MGAEVLVGTIVRPRGKRCRIVAKGRERETAGEKEKKSFHLSDTRGRYPANIGP